MLNYLNYKYVVNSYLSIYIHRYKLILIFNALNLIKNNAFKN